jgi:hypothetical protein
MWLRLIILWAARSGKNFQNFQGEYQNNRWHIIRRAARSVPNPLSYLPVFRIHDILVWIRIRGSMPLTYGSGSGSRYGSWSCYFHHLSSRCQQKTTFNFFFAFYFLKAHIHHFSKIKSPKEVINSGNQGFSYYFCYMIEGSRSLWLIGPNPGGPKTSGSGGSGSRLRTLLTTTCERGEMQDWMNSSHPMWAHVI